nr:unnamed protein product [Callosobruchus chinensis]
MIVISRTGHIVAGTSTNGAKFKIPGRKTSSFVNFRRFLSSGAVETRCVAIKSGQNSDNRIAEKYPNFFGGIVVTDKKGEIGAACNGMDKFPFTIANERFPSGITKYMCTVSINIFVNAKGNVDFNVISTDIH